ncbi:MAG: DEAD/DEAH box helicase family protein [Gammaproteobacteria bacterium]|nr:DEAD/DEAH box helicase family protein [Gammaproteobacteria bacterium]
MTEATARIKINKLLEAAGWRFFNENGRAANIVLEAGVSIRESDLDALGNDFEKIKGYIDFLLLDDKGRPCIVLEAKSEGKQPLAGKEQARKYARSQNCRFVLLSNGNLHYFWDLERGNPYLITSFPTPDSAASYRQVTPDPKRLINEPVDRDYIVLTQRPGYASEAAWKIADEQPVYIQANKLKFLRDYQLQAVQTLQKAIGQGNDRFLFEMATGTGKTLTAAVVIKLFLHTGNARRVLFLVDRLELEDQARKAFTALLKNDFQTVVYKENRTNWRLADIVVSTVQSLQFNNKYQQLFCPTDFDLVISDEAHRSIGGNARAVFEYFVGYKLGLTATPRDYLKGINMDEQDTRDNKKSGYSGNEGNADANVKPVVRDPREIERRLLLDTYRTFGCASGQPTFRYSLLDGVRDNVLISPTVVNARTDVTTQLLSEQGFIAAFTDDSGEEQEESYMKRDFEKKFFSEATNELFCKTFLQNALHDPVSGELGKSIIFTVSQQHAARLTQILNVMADALFPGKYQSDFAVQVTSHVTDAQQFTINFANNNLLGSGNFMPEYRTSKARVCVTVGMMTTGYDCTDILNIGMFRPIFSPTDFIQIKGRGTRTHDFLELLFDEGFKNTTAATRKTAFKLFDFFGNCEYFENEFDYDEVIELPQPGSGAGGGEGRPPAGAYDYTGKDALSSHDEQLIGLEGMKIDRMMFFNRFADTVRENETIVRAVEAGEWDRVIDYVNREVFDKPEDYYNLEKLRQAAAVDRRLSLREILEKVFDLIPRFKSKDELLEEEFAKFIADYKPADSIPAIKAFFKAYISNNQIRNIVENRDYTELATTPVFSSSDLKAVPQEYRAIIPEYVKDYVALNQFM